MTSLGELFIELGFDVDETKLKDFNSQIKESVNGLLRLAAVTAGVDLSVNAFLAGLDRASGIKQFGDQLGYSTEAFQKWASVINLTNPLISLEQAKARYRAFAEYIRTVQWGGGGNLLSQLGVNYTPGADPAQYLDQLSAKLPAFVAQYGRARASMLLDQIGIGAGSLDALLTNAGQRNSMTAGLINSESEIQAVDELNRKLAEVQQRWEHFVISLDARWAGRIEEAVNRIEALLERWIPKLDEAAQALGGWERVGEGVLAYFAGKWVIGMLAAIGRVTAAWGVLGASGIAAVAPGLGVVAAGAAGAAVPFWLDSKTGWGQKFADWVAPVKSWGDVLAEQRANKQAEYLLGGPDNAQSPQQLTINVPITTTGDQDSTRAAVRAGIQDALNKTYPTLDLGPRY